MWTSSNLIVLDHKESNLAKTQEKDFKVEIMNVFEDIKEGINKSLTEDCENTNNEQLKIIQEMKEESNKQVESI